MSSGDEASAPAGGAGGEPDARAFSAMNRLLASLPEASLAQLLAAAEYVLLAHRQVLHQADAPISHVYFPLRASVSLVTLTESGASIETAIVGNEGLVGLSVFLGLDTDINQAIVQAPGAALRLPTAAFRLLTERDPALRHAIYRYAYLLLIQVTQSAVCNRMHSLLQRYARWLLMTHDRVGADAFPLTQEFLAAMLGVRRASITLATGVLQRAGLIEHQRGRITVLDRVRLEEAACECYAKVVAITDRLLKPLEPW